jgi:hypothetical protein
MKLLHVTLALLLTGSLACSRAGASKPPSPVLQLQPRCELPPMPPWTPVEAVRGGHGNCPAEFAACLAPSEAVLLASQLEKLGQWAAEAWLRCGPRSAPGAAPSSSARRGPDSSAVSTPRTATAAGSYSSRVGER